MQAKKYNKKAKEFWKDKYDQLINEITETIDSNSDLELVKMSKDFVAKTGFTQMICSVSDIHDLKNIIKVFGKEVVVGDFVNYGARTGFLTVVIAPALAAAEGLGDFDESNIEKWLYGIGICLPVAADICDSVLDEEVMRHPLIPYRIWIVCHKLGAAIIFRIGLNQIKEIKTGDSELDKKVVNRLFQGIKKVSEKQMIDYKVKESHYVPVKKLEEIYDGKVCEIEATVFGTLPSKKTEIVKIFEEGARHFAGELQIVDDFEDLIGDSNLQKLPEIPNPSFFLTYSVDLWKSGNKDIKVIMNEAARKVFERGKEYHKGVMNAFNKLPKNFKNKPFFEVTLWYYNKVLNERFKEFLKGKTYPQIKNQLLNMLKSN
jgi:hypothetical protein